MVVVVVVSAVVKAAVRPTAPDPLLAKIVDPAV
jgi:hypothetical protein